MKQLFSTLSLTFLLGGGGLYGDMILASDLEAKLQDPATAPMLIDIRPTEIFKKGSIPGAINIPGQVLLEKSLRFRNGIILVSDGIADPCDPAKLAGELEEKGVSADYLHGGLAAWQELQGANLTRSESVSFSRTIRTVRYEDIKDRSGGVCIVDLRCHDERELPEGHTCPVKGLCDAREFHYCTELSDFHSANGGQSREERAGTGPLVVLIPGEDTDNEAVLRKLEVDGHRRVAVLLGGADIIAVDGLRSKKRVGGKFLEVDKKKFLHAVNPEASETEQQTENDNE